MRSSLYSNSLLSPFLSQAKEREEEEQKERAKTLHNNGNNKTRTTFFRVCIYARAL
jgi:hypothetical protein